MLEAEQLCERIRALAEPILAERELELVELTCGRQGTQWHVRLLIDGIGGVTIQQCAQVNRLLSQAVQPSHESGEIATVEVSSPGVDRPLSSRRDFERALGERIQAQVLGEEHRVQTLQGMVLAVQESAVVLKTARGAVTLPLERIRRAEKVLRW
jgi:ribosome maturation factor RimP